MSRAFGEDEDGIDLEEVDQLLDVDEFLDEEDAHLGAAISACHISSVEECFVNSIGKCPEDDQAVTFPEIVQEGKKDPQYTALLEAVRGGFPEKEEECSALIQPFWKCRLNISVTHQGELEFLVYHDSDLRTRIVIPRSLRTRVKKILHADHRRDLARVKKRAEEHVYLPGMSFEL